MKKNKDWWHEPAYIAAIAGIIALIAPLTATVNKIFESRAQLEAQQHDIGIKYLDRAIDPNQTADDKESVLDFIIAMTNSKDKIRNWAIERKNKTSKFINLQKKRDDLLKQLENKDNEIKNFVDNTKNKAKFLPLIKKLERERDIVLKNLNELDKSINKAGREAFIEVSLVKGSDYRGDLWLPKGYRLVKIDVVQRPHHEEFYEAEYYIANSEGECGYADEEYYTCQTILGENSNSVTLIGRNLKANMVATFRLEDVNGRVLDESTEEGKQENGWAIVEYIVWSPQKIKPGS